MRRYWLLLVPLVAWGCTEKHASSLGSDPGAYVLRDTTDYDHILYPGSYALLVRNDTVVDSVDAHFEVQRLNSGAVVFLPVRASGIEDDVPGMDMTGYVASDGRRRVSLESFLPHFNDQFSSPAVIDGILYYWGLEKDAATPNYKLHAMRYDASAHRVDSRFLLGHGLETDNRGHLGQPFAESGMIRFETFGYAVRLSSDLKRGERVPADAR